MQATTGATEMSPGAGTTSAIQCALQWCRESGRTIIFRAPRWDGLHTNAAVIAILVSGYLLLTILLQRLYITGPAVFHWRAVTGGWIGILVCAWSCFLVRPGSDSPTHPEAAPGPAHLFTMIMGQTLWIMVCTGIPFVILVRSGFVAHAVWLRWAIWGLWWSVVVWAIVVEIVLLWRGSDRRRGPMSIAALTVVAATVLVYAARPAEFWYAKKAQEDASDRYSLKLTQELMEAQPRLLAKQLDEIKPASKKTGAFYAITFAPYDDDVFKRESDVVAQVIAERFDAQGRVLQLVNHSRTAETRPWATPLNLQRSIQRFAQVMDRDEDILFLHLTSHGARNGTLSADLWPMEVDSLHPAELKKWLDEAGIRNRIISVSACYSGSWIEPLADDNTLVMTAADADHTSYGCGSKSELTFFGRAMYDEQLRNPSVSFEEAYRNARKVIKEREESAGKDDGFSNPQFRMGINIGSRLRALQLAKGGGS